MSKAFTLIETIMYLALFTILIGGAVSASYEFKATLDTDETQAILNEEELFITNKIGWMTRHALKVSAPAMDQATSILSIISFDETKMTIDLQGSNLTETDDTKKFPLTGSNFTTGLLRFKHEGETTNSPETIVVTFIMTTHMRSGKLVSDNVTKTFFLEHS